jgi:hypothetical protein
MPKFLTKGNQNGEDLLFGSNLPVDWERSKKGLLKGDSSRQGDWQAGSLQDEDLKIEQKPLLTNFHKFFRVAKDLILPVALKFLLRKTSKPPAREVCGARSRSRELNERHQPNRQHTISNTQSTTTQ